MGQRRTINTIEQGRSLAAVIGRLIGKPYALGEVDGGLDCFSSIYRYLEERGEDLPDEFQGLTLRNYAELFLDDPARAKAVMVDFMDQVADPIDPARAFAGDVLLLRARDAGEQDFPFLGIHGGGTNVVCSSREHGVTVYQRTNYTIERAWRCRRQYLPS